jgi:hypothetical protein
MSNGNDLVDSFLTSIVKIMGLIPGQGQANDYDLIFAAFPLKG